MTIAPMPNLKPVSHQTVKAKPRVEIPERKTVNLNDPAIKNFIDKAPDGSRRRGRPATGRMPVITLQLPEEIIERLDSVSKSIGQSRAVLIRSFIVDGLSRRS